LDLAVAEAGGEGVDSPKKIEARIVEKQALLEMIQKEVEAKKKELDEMLVKGETYKTSDVTGLKDQMKRLEAADYTRVAQKEAGMGGEDTRRTKVSEGRSTDLKRTAWKDYLLMINPATIPVAPLKKAYDLYQYGKKGGGRDQQKSEDAYTASKAGLDAAEMAKLEQEAIFNQLKEEGKSAEKIAEAKEKLEKLVEEELKLRGELVEEEKKKKREEKEKEKEKEGIPKERLDLEGLTKSDRNEVLGFEDIVAGAKREGDKDKAAVYQKKIDAILGQPKYVGTAVNQSVGGVGNVANLDLSAFGDNEVHVVKALERIALADSNIKELKRQIRGKEDLGAPPDIVDPVKADLANQEANRQRAFEILDSIPFQQDPRLVADTGEAGGGPGLVRKGLATVGDWTNQ